MSERTDILKLANRMYFYNTESNDDEIVIDWYEHRRTYMKSFVNHKDNIQSSWAVLSLDFVQLVFK